MTIYYESELAHHGVKGMKWGRRKGNSNSATRKKAQRINASRSLPSKFGTYALTGVGGNQTYNTARATGRGKLKSGAYAFGASVAGSVIGTGIGSMAASKLAKDEMTAQSITTGASIVGSMFANRLVSYTLEKRNDAALAKKKKRY